jgi:hypothetical protein
MTQHIGPLLDHLKPLQEAVEELANQLPDADFEARQVRGSSSLPAGRHARGDATAAPRGAEAARARVSTPTAMVRACTSNPTS